MFIGITQIIKGMEEFNLSLFLTFEELDIVDDKAVDIAVFFTEGFRIFIVDGVNDFVSEVFTGNVKNFHGRVVLFDAVTNGVHQVSFAKTYTAV